MLGLGDIWVTFIFYLTILSVVLCVVYGIVNWNKGQDENELASKEKQWKKDESNIEEGL
jgi:hypothetical protein